MLFPVQVDTKLREGLMSSRVFSCEHLTRIICTRQTPNVYCFKANIVNGLIQLSIVGFKGIELLLTTLHMLTCLLILVNTVMQVE